MNQHLYLVFNADGDPATTFLDQEIIRGGPQNDLNFNPLATDFNTDAGKILIEIGEDEVFSQDAFDIGETAEDRSFRFLLEGAVATTKWEDFKLTAQSLGVYDSLAKKT